jgi:hypothetical protein
MNERAGQSAQAYRPAPVVFVLFTPRSIGPIVTAVLGTAMTSGRRSNAANS